MREAEYLDEPEHTCTRCGARLPLDQFARDASKRRGIKSWCRSCDSVRALAYYRERHPLVVRHCAECGAELEGRRRVVCSERCREARFKRLHPDAYAKREAEKVERRRERRRELREREKLPAAVSS